MVSFSQEIIIGDFLITDVTDDIGYDGLGFEVIPELLDRSEFLLVPAVEDNARGPGRFEIMDSFIPADLFRFIPQVIIPEKFPDFAD
jgi:hypothetical protein